MSSSEDKLWVGNYQNDQQLALIIKSFLVTDIFRPPNTSWILLQLRNPTRKRVLEPISLQQLKQLKNHYQPHTQHLQLLPVLAVRPFIIQPRTLQFIGNKPLAPTLMTAQAMYKALIRPQLTGILQGDGEEAHLVSDFLATCRIDHLMF